MMVTSFLEGILFHVGRFPISGSIVMSWFITLLLAIFSFLATRNLKAEPGGLQTVLEGAVQAMEDAIESVVPSRGMLLLPFVGTLWIFILVANLIGMIPGSFSPTSDLSVTAALAILVFLSVHVFGIKIEGLRYLKHYVEPNPIMLPFEIISELSRTISLSVRLFGNVMSLEIAAFIALTLAGFLVPIPLLMLHIVEALIQAYIFGMLALVYIAGAIESEDIRIEKENRI